MPLNTANKRGSAVATAREWISILPVPNAAIDQADRQQVTWSYAGILAGPPGNVPLLGACADLSIAAKPIAVLVMQAKPIAALVAQGC